MGWLAQALVRLILPLISTLMSQAQAQPEVPRICTEAGPLDKEIHEAKKDPKLLEASYGGVLLKTDGFELDAYSKLGVADDRMPFPSEIYGITLVRSLGDGSFAVFADDRMYVVSASLVDGKARLTGKTKMPSLYKEPCGFLSSLFQLCELLDPDWSDELHQAISFGYNEEGSRETRVYGVNAAQSPLRGLPITTWADVSGSGSVIVRVEGGWSYITDGIDLVLLSRPEDGRVIPDFSEQRRQYFVRNDRGVTVIHGLSLQRFPFERSTHGEWRNYLQTASAPNMLLAVRNREAVLIDEKGAIVDRVEFSQPDFRVGRVADVVRADGFAVISPFGGEGRTMLIKVCE